MTFSTAKPAVRRLHPFVLGVGFLSTYYVALLGPILPAVAGPMGGDALAIGLLFSSYSLAQFLTAPILGALGDRYGRRIVLVCSFIGAITGFGVFTVGAATGAGLWMLFLGWIIVGASDCWIATAYSYVADTTAPAVRTRYFAFLTAAIGSAFIIGPATSGLFSATNPVTPLFVLLALLSVALVWGCLSMPESLPRGRRTASLPLAQMNPLAQLRDILGFPQLRLLLLSYLLFWPAVIALTANMPTLLTDLGGWNTGRIASVLMIYGVLVVTVQLIFIPLLVRRFHEIHLAMAGAALSVVAFVLVALFAEAGSASLIYLAVALFGVGQPLVQTSLTSAMSKSMDAHIQGRVQGAIAATMAMAQVLGPLAVGWLYGAFAPAAPYWVVAFQMVVAVVLMMLAKARIPSLTQAATATAPLSTNHHERNS
ncbi:MFS transporter [Mycobacterium sp. MS1601]|uniref:MFS transporter n=1 Tax=Mycobacterium sp. MS1601 TaxID=1936029 RepID=UPI00178CA895|nr:MFS transporter [Mycobacterium sp. MS1601]